MLISRWNIEIGKDENDNKNVINTQ
jgi:hypothetical protein